MSDFEFHKSSYSGGQPDSQWVDVAVNIPSVVAVRDSKRADGPSVHLTPAAWTAFLTHTTCPSARARRP
ncbi:DUF397 domain-containing protein [Streptomyces sp. JJ38]|uniref:DUF397 domain-containing protein n=1 Tax=Streptomyces sp. JJ38 TaxID=2738128 RepID=UPI001C56F77D|nr:DUF397 domain-containing protein [Streptomyces sp. JJ38]MBW1596942.1 DUF397 domain-containing protein [Streptomyces sp. JJ38]